jgi:hypothetical protein
MMTTNTVTLPDGCSYSFATAREAVSFARCMVRAFRREGRPGLVDLRADGRWCALRGSRIAVLDGHNANPLTTRGFRGWQRMEWTAAWHAHRN